MDLSSKTVLELRKLAKENGIKLAAGINKAEIIEKLEAALSEDEGEQLSLLDAFQEAETPIPPKQEKKAEEAASPTESQLTPEPPAPVPSPVHSSAPIVPAPVIPSAAPAGEKDPAAQSKEASGPHYRATWHNANPANQSKFAAQGRQGWNQGTQATPPTQPRQSSSAAPGFGPRFGPAAFGPQGGGFGPQSVPTSPVPPVTSGAAASETSAPAVLAQEHQEEAPRMSFGPPPRSYEPKPYSRQNTRSYGNTGRYDGGRGTESAQKLPSLQDLITPQDLTPASGIFELISDGYGFLRGDQLTPSSRDIYVSVPLVRRGELRNGDFVEGQLRPAREGDKYAALLYIDRVNGKEPGAEARVSFDDLTPVYPNRRLSLDDPRYPDARMIDLLCPIGLGSRALMLFPPECGKRQILLDTCNAILAQNKDVELIPLIIDFAPEEVTAVRDALPCPVIATTFDQTPESQMRLIDLTQERAHRLAESGKDVVLIVDSLTRLVKTYAAAAQQSRQSTGSINPTSLFRAKKIFGAARCAREGGSLTVIATMDIESGVKLDEAIVEEFRSTATTDIVFDSSIARLNAYPPLHYQRSRTRRPELILDEKELEGLEALRELLSSGSPAAAVGQVMGLIDKVTHNRDVLSKIKEWAALMSGGRAKS